MTERHLTRDEAWALLEERGALLRGHFQYASGRHGELYIEKFRILQWPDVTEPLCRQIAERFRGTATVVAGPTTGGVILAYETARQLGLRAIIAERKEEGSEEREFRRGFELGPGERVLVVDDVLTTGGSIREVLKAVAARGAEVAGVGVLVDRTAGKVGFGVPFFACLDVPAASWDPADCRLCREGVPLVVT
ncbi:orotate phosphoribosyltransferase [Tepidiforma flava]|uniref:Orotate phosphoribosyltransferase n=1 Tax=Tepidiforma flava TaxID=3004094 RepID=A0ABY7M548_9CHLR|nr:orotate phosphoribosyltransferase [Tepidiforma flava]WBL35125.1 orotate phosphoribosyltransferase [Tepidiforma flava]